MPIHQWINDATARLGVSGITTARLDVLVLLEDMISRDRSWLLAHPEFELTAAQTDRLEKLLSRRAAHEPLAYLRGKTEFYGRDFVVSAAVLEPRPESETMIDLLKKLDVFNRTDTSPGVSTNLPDGRHEDQGVRTETKLDSLLHASVVSQDREQSTGETAHPIAIADVGAGSGALGITAALELPDASVDLLELDPAACQVAKTNVDLFTLNISVIESDLLAGAPRTYDIVLCNLPYVPDGHTINQAALHEPAMAIFGGADGLDLYHRLFDQIAEMPARPLYILTEALPPQHAALADIAAAAGYKLAKTDDFIQLFGRMD